MTTDNITYPLTMTHRRTMITANPFQNKHVRAIIDKYIRTVTTLSVGLQGKDPLICDPFANESFTQLMDNCITNDLNPEFDTDFNLEFNEFAERMFGADFDFDLILFDPPYSLTQLKRRYEAIGKELELWQTHNMWGIGKDLLAQCVKVGGYVISLGWNSQGFGQKRGFVKKEVHLFEQIGREGQYDLILTVEQKVQVKLDLQFEETVE